MIDRLSLTALQFIATIPDYVYWKNKQGIYQGCNKRFAKAIGLSTEKDIVGKNDIDLFPKERAEEIRAHDHQIMETGVSDYFEETPFIIEDIPITTLTHKVPWKDDDGHIVGLFSVAFDITAWKKEQERLRQYDEYADIYLKNIIANLPDHVFWEDTNGVFLGCNEQQAKSFGFQNARALVGKTLWDAGTNIGWSKSRIQQLREHDVEVMRTGKTISVEEDVIWADGLLRTFLSKKAQLKDSQDRCIGMLGLAFDITERKQMEKNLREAKKRAEAANTAKSDFITNISHDLRTPLHTLLGTAELMQLQPHTPEQEKHIQAIIQSGETLLNLVENILSFAKIEQGGVTLNCEIFDLQQLILGVVAILQKSAEEKNIDIVTRFSESLPKQVISDPDAIQRIVMNLLGNAIKFTDHGRISITVTSPLLKADENEAICQLIVKDTGIGIPQHELHRIFERFHRINPSYQEKYKGSGLGLAITQKLVDSLKGTIQVDSELGVGTTFTCTLPLQLSHPTSSQRSRKRQPLILQKKYSLSILLVEDAPLIQKFSVSLFETLGCKVTLAHTGKEALLLASNTYDLIFMDIGLPDEDGLSVIKKIRILETEENKNPTPIIALTAHATEKVKQECFDAGADDFLPKPASLGEILKFLDKYTHPT